MGRCFLLCLFLVFRAFSFPRCAGCVLERVGCCWLIYLFLSFRSSSAETRAFGFFYAGCFVSVCGQQEHWLTFFAVVASSLLVLSCRSGALKIKARTSWLFLLAWRVWADIFVCCCIHLYFCFLLLWCLRNFSDKKSIRCCCLFFLQSLYLSFYFFILLGGNNINNTFYSCRPLICILENGGEI